MVAPNWIALSAAAAAPATVIELKMSTSGIATRARMMSNNISLAA
jgi:hypothetical protein